MVRLLAHSPVGDIESAAEIVEAISGQMKASVLP